MARSWLVQCTSVCVILAIRLCVSVVVLVSHPQWPATYSRPQAKSSHPAGQPPTPHLRQELHNQTESALRRGHESQTCSISQPL